MDSNSTTAVVESPDQTSQSLPRITRKTILLLVFIPILSLLFASCLKESTNSSHNEDRKPSHHYTSPKPLRPIIKNACANTLYPAFCLTTLSSIPASKNATTFQNVLQISINHTVKFAIDAQSEVARLYARQDLVSVSQQKNALRDCAELLDQTLYELGLAIDELRSFPATVGFARRSVGNLKSLLSAAMTNENTCINGFSEMEENDSVLIKALMDNLQEMLVPISRMISNCLAMIKYLETMSQEEALVNDHHMFISKFGKQRFPPWMTSSDRNLLEGAIITRPNVIVSKDRSGNCSSIQEAVRMAPNMSREKFIIKIKAGVYVENVEIPREKINVMFLGDGMNSTVISGSRSFVDGFSTFTSATLTVVGDRFLARDLTIINTAGPHKHQAVAARVTSNAAFYRCNFSSYQDTLYAHSLRQFYRECTIQGTIDFIFGNAAAVFQNCLVLVRRPLPGQKNMITAQGREDPNQNTGISLQNCVIKAAPEFRADEWRNFSTFLGRPWRNYSRTVVMKSYIGNLIEPRGWTKWDGYSTIDTVEYIEYLNFGPGSDTRRRVAWEGYIRNCTEEIAKRFTVEAFLQGQHDWLESTGFLPFSRKQIH